MVPLMKLTDYGGGVASNNRSTATHGAGDAHAVTLSQANGRWILLVRILRVYIRRQLVEASVGIPFRRSWSRGSLAEGDTTRAKRTRPHNNESHDASAWNQIIVASLKVMGSIVERGPQLCARC